MREINGEFNVYLLRRSSKSTFMPGKYVFPGGMLEKGDREINFWLKHTDSSLHAVSEKLGGDISGESALAYGIAAIRETFEEAGVFPGDLTGEKMKNLCGLRSSGKLSKGWFKSWIDSNGGLLPISELWRWSHWMTPENSPLRFDTRFFVTFIPDGQECTPDLSETTAGIWVTPQQGLEGNTSGNIPMAPPTIVTLQELLEFRGIEQLKENIRIRGWGEVTMPQQIFSGGESIIIFPWDPEYGRYGEIDLEKARSSALPPGEPFSRLCTDKGVWKPVSL
jgi:8-oxo-dGTP pyrophosphatase MutT (NUDIX family)